MRFFRHLPAVYLLTVYLQWYQKKSLKTNQGKLFKKKNRNGQGNLVARSPTAKTEWDLGTRLRSRINQKNGRSYKTECIPEQTGALQIACFGFSAISWLPFIPLPLDFTCDWKQWFQLKSEEMENNNVGDQNEC